MVAVHTHRYSHQLIEKGGSFALHVLAESRKNFLSRFKGKDPKAKFCALNWTTGKTGCPIHTLFIGDVIDAGVLAKGSPLTTGEYDGVYLGKD
jgi:hypothetical protein